MFLPDGLLTLGLPDLRLLVTLGQNVLEGGSDNGALELLGLLGPLLGGLLLDTLPVLPPVEDGPGHLPGVPPHEMGLVALAVQELEDLAIGLDEGAALAGQDLEPAVRAKFDPEKKIVV